GCEWRRAMNKQLEERMKVDPILREFYPKLPPLRAKPKTEVRTQLEGKIAEAAQANPDSVRVRVTARGPDETVVIDRPRSGLVEVIEVDALGRPKLTRKFNPETQEYDPETGKWTRRWDLIEHNAGYSPPSEKVLDERGGGV